MNVLRQAEQTVNRLKQTNTEEKEKAWNHSHIAAVDDEEKGLAVA